jgi:Flp pilus assembly protein TadD
MKCPACELYHPQHFERCVSCGRKLVSSSPGATVVETEDDVTEKDEWATNPPPVRQSSQRPAPRKTSEGPAPRKTSEGSADIPTGQPYVKRRAHSNQPDKGTAGLPVLFGFFLVAVVLLVSAGATIFFLTKSPDDQRLFDQAQKEIANGQFAFAVKTLDKARALRPNDPKVYLSLARAYVGIDQVDKAWDAISQAQQLGAGVVAEPALASDLANYYRQRGQFEKALDLLRPLAKAGVEGKRAELADLDAMWGDEALRNGHPELALRCWEEVRDLKEGSRYSEAEARLSTIYGKMANVLASKREDDKALSYIAKLNYIAQNAKNYELAASIYERDGKMDEAIDQIRQALKVSPHDALLEHKLVDLLNRRGKELLDTGKDEEGYAYLQQAKQLDSRSAVPLVALKKLTVTVDSGTHFPHLSGQIWNPGDSPVNSLTLKSELWDGTKSEVVWTKEEHIVDEFVSALGAKESRPFDFIASIPTKANGESEFRIYLDGTLYKSYPIGKKVEEIGTDETTAAADETHNRKESKAKVETTDTTPTSQAPSAVTRAEEKRSEPPVSTGTAPVPGGTSSVPPVAPARGPSAEEKTMKDLEF